MKILTIYGTRPELIRLNLTLKLLDLYTTNITVHTGQNYDFELNDIFIKEFGIRKPDYYLGSTGSFAQQIANSFIEFEKILKKEKPNKILVLGDTNSSVTSIIAKRMHIPIFHIEAGNRCYNPYSPEEVNRKIIDHCSDIHIVYSNRSFNNLKKEGIDQKSIFILGNPIAEVLKYYNNKIKNSKILNLLKLKKNKYILVTLHREENVDNLSKLSKILNFLNQLSISYGVKIIWPMHPRTLKNFSKINNKFDNIKYIKPLGFFDFIFLQKKSMLVVTDSGTVQEECSILKIPFIILRDSTERDETIEKGSGLLINNFDSNLNNHIDFLIRSKKLMETPSEYLLENFSHKMLNLILCDFKYLK